MEAGLLTVELHYHDQTDRMIQVSDNSNPVNAIWLPKRVIDFVRIGDKVSVTGPAWLLYMNGIF